MHAGQCSRHGPIADLRCNMMQESVDEYPYSTYMYLIERLNEMQNLCVPHIALACLLSGSGTAAVGNGMPSLMPFQCRLCC